ncbi:hypothetical protein B0O99DRAFT_613270 [Bisporella sp. PMI_857]|nr:hypothetical protein B0O99DRAFT_613270 [Bisporella sp. PMI_857]
MVEIKTWKVTEPYLDLKCGLGEAPYYEAIRNHLRFVDIKKHQLHVINLTVGPSSLKTIQLDMPVGVTADIEGIDSSEKILIGGKHGPAILDRRTEKYELLGYFHDNRGLDDRLRSNDGAVDPQGRFWIGTMNDFHVGPPQAEGTLFRFDNDLKRNIIREGLTIPNGVGWSTDHKSLYFTHSAEREIWKYDFDVKTGDVSNGKVWYKHDGEGEPDGFKMDEEGNIWQSIYNEGRVLRIGPEGKVTGVVELPTRATTCPCFVGTELWITSAQEEEPEKYPESARCGGGLFKVDVGAKGLKEFEFKYTGTKKL